MESTSQLEAQLSDFSPTRRMQALEALIASGNTAGASQEAVNLHCHTFFSYNAYGYSPSGLAWLARQRGFKALGIVDFDVLSGVDEFLEEVEEGARAGAGEDVLNVPEELRVAGLCWWLLWHWCLLGVGWEAWASAPGC